MGKQGEVTVLRNTKTQYGSIAKFFHWLIFVLVLGLLIVGFTWEDFPVPQKFTLIDIHKLTGLSVLLLVILRVVWSFINIKPGLPWAVKAWERIAEYSVHGLLYLLLLAMPVSGWIMSTAAGRPPQIGGHLIPAPGIAINSSLARTALTLHVTFAWCLIALVTLHILAAFKHYLINKDNILQRMLPWKVE